MSRMPQRCRIIWPSAQCSLRPQKQAATGKSPPASLQSQKDESDTLSTATSYGSGLTQGITRLQSGGHPGKLEGL